ncbi:magnesium-translocating P-type ATPase [Streptomyces sp. NPDC059479]|uniref:magnesium-translocating P-type ATPase n=1 Tax=Streptomyces sp. NPDC059479 TaxID=3346848 RepID=UPI0036AFD519
MPETAAAPGRDGRTVPAPSDIAVAPYCPTARGVATLTSLQVLRMLDSSPRGLSEEQAEERLVTYGENALPGWRTVPWAWRFARSVRDPFTAVLLCLGLVSAAVAAWSTAAVILVLVVVSCVLRSSGEHHADRSIAALRELVATTATVQRRAPGGGRPREIPVDLLVPGDVIRLGPGDLVPADVRLLRACGLTVHQAALTGESTPVDKDAVDAPGGLHEGPFDRAQLCFQGSSVASGSATAVVVATGARTELAHVHREPVRQRGQSAFDRSVHGIAWTLIRFMLLTPPLVLMTNAALRGRGLETMSFAVAVAVGLTPEMLPVIVTTALARGAARLARDHAVIVKRLPALHDLGAVDVLCLDKTGTLTQDRPVVDSAVDAYGRPDPRVLHWAAVGSLWTLQLAELPVPDALDEAILDAAGEDDLLAYDGVAALPFDPDRRLATAVVRGRSRHGTHTLVAKGAVEDVLRRCTRYGLDGAGTELDKAEREKLLDYANAEAESGLRLLAVALAERPARLGAYTTGDERGLTFIGFVALRDALAPTAATALAALTRRGVTVKILTGDHPGTATRACRDLGLAVGEAVTAEDLAGLTGPALAEAATRATVVARCTAEDKARILGALREAGHTAGFLGDGVNDLAALHAADVGVCPRNAVDVVRESADVVLVVKDLAALDHAITAGRNSSANIASYLRITLSSNLGNVIAMLTAGLLLPFLPMLPAQVLVQNLCFDAAQLAFAFDRPSPTEVRHPTALRPRAFLRFITGFGLLNATADLATFTVLALAARAAPGAQGQPVFHGGWFTENLLTQALVMLLLRTGRRAAEGRTFGPVRIAATALAAIGVLVPLSPLGPALGMTAPPLLYYTLLAAVLAVYGTALVALRARLRDRPATPMVI